MSQTMSNILHGLTNNSRFRKIAFPAVVALGSAIVIYLIVRQVPPGPAGSIQARLELAAGEVVLEQEGRKGPALSGEGMLPGSVLKTKAGARALVRLSDGSAVFLREGSEIRLAADAINLRAGEVFLDAPPAERSSLLHRAGDVLVSAVDAGLTIRRTAAGASVYVARGSATVTGPGGRAEVRAGERAVVEGTSKPEVSPVAFGEDWTGGMADRRMAGVAPGTGSGRIFGVDLGGRAGAPARPLEVARQTVRTVVRSGLAETEVDQTFFNPGDRAVEGWFWFSVPADASVTGFAVETNGTLVEGEFIERREASARYAQAVSSGHEPALLDWVNDHTFRARIYPINASEYRRVVLRYLQLLPQTGGGFRYVYPMQSDRPVRIGEFSLSVDLGDPGRNMALSTLSDARVEDGGRRVSMRRSGYIPRADFVLEAKPSREPEPLRVARYRAGKDEADYVMIRYVPDLDFGAAGTPRGDVVVVVDTSAGGDEAARALKASTAGAILRALSSDDRFALVALDVSSTVLYPPEGLAAARPEEIGKAIVRLAEHGAGGATDIGSFFDAALTRVHGSEQPAVIYVGDGQPSSGETRPERLVERLRQSLATSRARLFTVGVGALANRPLLEALARAGGGDSFQVDEAESVSERALRLVAALKTPTITDLSLDLGAGLDEMFTSANGKVQRGHEVSVLARTHHDLPSAVKVRGRLGGKPFDREYRWRSDPGILTAFVPRLWAAEQLRRLLGSTEDPETVRGKVMQLGIAFGLMTPYTSILALESEQAYQQQGIQRRISALRGIRLSSIGSGQGLGAGTIDVLGAVATIGLGCNAEESRKLHDQVAALNTENVNLKAKIADSQVAAGSSYGRFEATDRSGQLPQLNGFTIRGNAALEAEGARVFKAERKKAALAGEKKPKFSAPKKAKGEASGAGYGSQPSADEGADFKSAMTSSGLGKMASSGGGRGGFSAPGKIAAAREPSPPPLLPPPPSTPEPAPIDVTLKSCSDAASRPLYERVVLWGRRLQTASNGPDVLDRYISARQACELSDWHAESNFLYLAQGRLANEGDVAHVLRAFASDRETQVFLARLVLRRTVDERVVAVVEKVLFGDDLNWANVDNELAALRDVDARVERLRQIMARAPSDPKGIIRLVRLLVEAGRMGDALAEARRLRDTGLATPFLARELGDLLATEKLDAEAIRTYSEIVEFDPQNLASRRLLGEVYLAHAWYEPAYRQFKLLSETAPNDAQYALRLAMAAAGAGRIDEALRLERQVAASPGRPGPADPRRWAQLLSAARLARLLASPPPGAEGAGAGVKSKLKELQVFKGPATLVILTWEDLSADVALSTVRNGAEASVGQPTDAAPVGLYSVLVSGDDLSKVDLVTNLRSPTRKLPLDLVRQDVTWDGKDFAVKVSKIKLPQGESRVTM
ncbi:MAG: VWA domain-containing protein [Deltaproteobacteria bacterium]|nr:VWA domain-containing protein [Deltaproteobacteria bacterium]